MGTHDGNCLSPRESKFFLEKACGALTIELGICRHLTLRCHVAFSHVCHAIFSACSESKWPWKVHLAVRLALKMVTMPATIEVQVLTVVLEFIVWVCANTVVHLDAILHSDDGGKCPEVCPRLATVVQRLWEDRCPRWEASVLVDGLKHLHRWLKTIVHGIIKGVARTNTPRASGFAIAFTHPVPRQTAVAASGAIGVAIAIVEAESEHLRRWPHVVRPTNVFVVRLQLVVDLMGLVSGKDAPEFSFHCKDFLLRPCGPRCARDILPGWHCGCGSGCACNADVPHTSRTPTVWACGFFLTCMACGCAIEHGDALIAIIGYIALVAISLSAAVAHAAVGVAVPTPRIFQAVLACCVAVCNFDTAALTVGYIARCAVDLQIDGVQTPHAVGNFAPVTLYNRTSHGSGRALSSLNHTQPVGL
mmetsp:Transcript_20104/g.38042  ORF Transcript_20104/g.38042 Transcript_20104/m.38042 type:complete len:419 (-) Transcript_20104:145-1401(-)